MRTILSALILAILFCGCTDDANTAADVPADQAQISFVLSIVGDTQATRATWENNDNPENGNDYENSIDPNTLRVFIQEANADGTTTENGGLIEIEKLLFWAEDQTGTGDQTSSTTAKTYQFVGRLQPEDADKVKSGQTYKILVFANNDETKPEFDNLKTFDYNHDDVMNGKKFIPMFGFTTQPLTFTKGERTDIGTIDMLRAMAKVEVKISDNAPGWTITSATLNKSNNKGYTVPSGYESVADTKALTYDGDNNQTFNPYNALDGEDVDITGLTFTYDDTKKSAWLYIPEINNGTENSNDIVTIFLEMENSDGVKKEWTLYFRPYQDGSAVMTGTPQNIVRNHIYRYTVDVELMQISYQVLPWEVVESKIGYAPKPASTTENPFASDDTYKTFMKNGYILLPALSYSKDYPTTQAVFNYLYADASQGDAEPKYGAIYRPRFASDKGETMHKTLRNDTGGATFFFLFTGPEGATWEAHLTNTEDFSLSTASNAGDYFDECEIDFDGDGTIDTPPTYKVTHGIARKAPYVLQINANNNYTGVDTKGTVPTEGDKKTHYGLDENTTEATQLAEWEKRFGDEYLTEWGKEKWYGQKVVDTEFYITVRLTDGTEYELTINPPYPSGVSNTLYKENRRYPGTNTRIWIRQLRAMCGWGYEYLSADVSPIQTTGKDDLGRDIFQWWRVNPYWKTASTTNTSATE